MIIQGHNEVHSYLNLNEDVLFPCLKKMSQLVKYTDVSNSVLYVVFIWKILFDNPLNVAFFFTGSCSINMNTFLEIHMF
ncbi:hypothetical protein A3Q56_08774 [Intoshia linei]|uniref:Uncharacterized protein n=1 Tax=Intoshia linei TaxID=1819745 RepID=A0A177AN73_9BILA|nr:hypothetical protein A3Q56_08774 [Intoshia linei]